MNSMISIAKFKRFKQDLALRKASLAFKMTNVYFIGKRSKDVYKSLLQSPNKKIGISESIINEQNDIKYN